MERMLTRGFTLLEILLVVAMLAILVGSIVAAVNPAVQLAEARDAKRHQDVNALAEAFLQYYSRHGSYPENLPASDAVCYGLYTNSSFSICSEGYQCGGFSIADTLVGEGFITEIPQDPIDPSQTNPEYSGYLAFKNSNGHVRVCAPFAETEQISVIR